MRDFETLRVRIPPLAVVPGTVATGSSVDPTTPRQVGDDVPGTNYYIGQNGWDAEVEDDGPLSGSAFTSGPHYILKGLYRNQVEWYPWARSDIAMTPLGQEVAEGTNFRSFYTDYGGEVIGSAPNNSEFPAWSGVDLRVLDIWSSEEIEKKQLITLAENGWLPGAQPTYPLDIYSALNYEIINPADIEHKLRFDQIISARYRQFISSTNAPSSQYLGGQLVSIHDQVIGGNASMADVIHHARYVYFINSNKATTGEPNLRNPALGGTSTYNYAKVGWFVPSAMDTLTVGIAKIESDAEWATLARRGASR
jgi:hypothetical protein